MIISLILNIAGADTGPFSLYSDVGSYTTPFETGVLKTSLVSGYSTTAPTSTTTVRVKSVNSLCNNYIDIILEPYVPMCQLNGEGIINNP